MIQPGSWRENLSKGLIQASRFFIIAAFVFSMLPAPFQALLYVSLALCMIGFLLSVQNQRFQFDRWDAVLALFLLVSFLGLIFSDFKVSVLQGAGVFLIYYLIYLYGKNLVVDDRLWTAIAVAIALSLLLVCGFSLIHHFVIQRRIMIYFPWGGAYGIIVFPDNEPGRPVISLLEHHVLGANIIAILMTFLIGYFVHSFRKLKVISIILFSVSLTVAFVLLIFTYSRGAFLLLAVSVTVLIVFKKNWKILIGLLAAVAVALSIPNTRITSTLLDPLKAQNVPQRMLQYRASLEIWSRNNWLTGIGLLNFRHYYPAFYSRDSHYEGKIGAPVTTNGTIRFGPFREPVIREEPIPYVHNVYLSLLLETGVAGFLVFFAFLCAVFVKSLRHYCRFRDLPSLLMLMLLPGFLANALFDNLLYTVPAAILVWFFFGLSQNHRPPEALPIHHPSAREDAGEIGSS